MRSFAPAAAFSLLLTLGLLPACHRASRSQPRPHPKSGESASTPATADAQSSPPDFAVTPGAATEGNAFWYDVPAQSLPQRRAWTGEMTAASDSLPLNSYARVHRLDNTSDSKDVIVRITDKGIHHKGGIIDVDRGAAETLGIVKTGRARVRVEALTIKNATTDKPVDKKYDPPTPKVSEITSTPAAGQQDEKAAANAKANR